jgi:hypothetical protein
LADYGVAGVENERASAFLGGVIGVAITGLAGVGLYVWLREPNICRDKVKLSPERVVLDTQ